MTRRDWPRALPAAALGVLCVVLLALAMRGPPSWEPPDAGETAARLAPLAEDGGAESVFSPPPAGTFDIVIARNLFSVDRMPPPERTRSIGGVQANSADMILVGALIGVGRAVAILSDGASGETVHLPVGESFRGWQLVELDANSVVLRRDEESISLTLAFVESEDEPVRIQPSLPIEPRRGGLDGNPVRAERRSLFEIQRERAETTRDPPDRR